LRLDTLQDLRDYCYVVAGIVGEMLTELFIVGHAPLAADADALRGRAAAFGEGLQLVNILKDASADGVEGRRYLPKGVDLATVFELARTDLDRAAEYTTLLHDAAAPRGMIAFNALPVQLARATLDRVEQRGSGAKLTRPEVFAALAAMNADLDAGRTPVRPRQTETGS
jgi:farnesyl-diphosphate farnesyltransferase